MGKLEQKLVGHFHDIMKAYGLVGSPDATTLERAERVTLQLAQTIREATVESAMEVSKKLQNAVADSMERIEEELDRLDRKIEDGDRAGAEEVGRLIAVSRAIAENGQKILNAIEEVEEEANEE